MRSWALGMRSWTLMVRSAATPRVSNHEARYQAAVAIPPKLNALELFRSGRGDPDSAHSRDAWRDRRRGRRLWRSRADCARERLGVANAAAAKPRANAGRPDPAGPVRRIRAEGQDQRRQC